MSKATFDDGTTMFARSVLDAVRTRCIEGFPGLNKIQCFFSHVSAPQNCVKQWFHFMASQQPSQLRDFHGEIRGVLSQKDPTYKPSFAAMWADNMPEESAMVQQDLCMQFTCPGTISKFLFAKVCVQIFLGSFTWDCPDSSTYSAST